MEFNPQDQDIVRLLTKIKDVQIEYPVNMLAARRQSYLKRMTEIGSDMNGGESAPATHPPTVGTLFETALIVAILAEASVMAYFYRDKLADFFQSLATDSHTEEATPATALPTSQNIQGISPSPAASVTLPSASLAAIPAGMTETPTGTPFPDTVNNVASSTPEVKSTPIPNGNNGNHYGQTPKAERTKKNNGDNKPPKKPTKTK